MSLPSKQEAEATKVPLPMSVEGQLQWIKRPLSSLSGFSSVDEGAEDPPAVWWPSLLFNDYDTFQDFFPDEFSYDGASEAMQLIISRGFQNNLQQRTVMVARLLGCSISKFVELVQVPAEDKSVDIEAHHATEWVLFTRLPQEVGFSQMEADKFTVVAKSKTGEEVKIVDDVLYMSYMFALDLAYTKRMGGPNAPRDTLGTDFQDMGRKKLGKLPAEVKKLSEGSISLEECEVRWMEEQDEEDCDDEEDHSKSKPDAKAEKLAVPKEVSGCETTQASKVDSPAPTTDGDQPNSNKATNVKKSSEKEIENKNAESLAASLMKAPIESPKASKRGRRPKAKETVDLPAPVDPPKRSTRGRRPKKTTVKLVEQANKLPEKAIKFPEEASKLPEKALSPPIQKKKRRGRLARPKKQVSLPQTPKMEAKSASPDAPLAADAPLFMTPSPTKESNTIVSDTSSPSSTNPGSLGIKSNDSFEEACEKLKDVGYSIDFTNKVYLCPGFGDEDMKNPRLKNKKYFLRTQEFTRFLRNEFGWEGKVTPIPEPSNRKRSKTATVTPSSVRPKRSRRSSEDSLSDSPVKKEGQIKFKTEDEEEFYHFPNLIKKLNGEGGWRYKPSKTRNWHYVLPGHPTEHQRGKHLEDFFYEEAEVVLYCVNNNYYERRRELGL
mmetsp:Transcript_12470/g.31399  ORF Transcript_12470/g.31399 Transcript_12470/m.31399 type:complete len:663 (+) Transcript_12470:95-2083(+)|eukprot:CAMPEP_0116106790 /NCGR_PEP_ID=MMETSP0327-20121206/15842_1 /TAXON_ID=44447 /ORGANISM="Pseudo-nitzschia delicatissima, Strain B596" /LENGTH=662 /DNA_ID=CAMNT_0003599463 /DNA_START=21 /DNA_END=2009 /DNA_ORIENTATION=+